jgi:hypothetical protein
VEGAANTLGAVLGAEARSTSAGSASFRRRASRGRPSFGGTAAHRDERYSAVGRQADAPRRAPGCRARAAPPGRCHRRIRARAPRVATRSTGSIAPPRGAGGGRMRPRAKPEPPAGRRARGAPAESASRSRLGTEAAVSSGIPVPAPPPAAQLLPPGCRALRCGGSVGGSRSGPRRRDPRAVSRIRPRLEGLPSRKAQAEILKPGTSNLAAACPVLPATLVRLAGTMSPTRPRVSPRAPAAVRWRAWSTVVTDRARMASQARASDRPDRFRPRRRAGSRAGRSARRRATRV